MKVIVQMMKILPPIEISETRAMEELKPVAELFNSYGLKGDIDFLRSREERLPDGREKRITFAAIARRAGCSRHSLRRWYNGLHQPRAPLPLMKIRLWADELRRLEEEA